MVSDAQNNLTAITLGVTGSRGFVGRALTAHLESVGARVVRLEGDVRDAATYTPSFDVLVHLAARVSSGRDADPVDIASVNVVGTVRALECCRQRGVPIVFTSTAGVYRPTTERRALSENAPIAPNWLYTLTKRMAEEMCEHYGRSHGVSGTILRLFNVYGPDQPVHFAIPYLIDAILAGQTVEIRNPHSVRDFIHVDDVISAIIRAALRSGSMRVFNVGTGVATAMADLSEMLRGLADPMDLKIFFGGRSDDPTPCVFADISRAKSELGWSPEIELKYGIAQCFEFARRNSG